MGNYFNELRWKIIRANNLLQLIHQVTIEIRFRKSLAQERFKSNLEFRNQIIVSSIKFWKCFAKFMIPIALFKKPSRNGEITLPFTDVGESCTSREFLTLPTCLLTLFAKLNSQEIFCIYSIALVNFVNFNWYIFHLLQCIKLFDNPFYIYGEPKIREPLYFMLRYFVFIFIQNT